MKGATEAGRIGKGGQYLASITAVVTVAAVCFAFTEYIGYRVVASLLLLTVSLIAVSFDIWPVLLTATLSALIWDVFFIPPRFAFRVHTVDDAILLGMYFIIAMVNAVLTFKIRQVEKLAREKEKRANAVKLYHAFLNSLSHELRTPIATIIGATDNLLAGNRNLTEANKEELVSEISRASLRLNRQVENLLSMSRLESGFLQPRKDWCDIAELLHKVAGDIRADYPDRELLVHQEPDFPLYRTDNGMLEQILFNLISNACIHTPAGTAISVSAHGRPHGLQLLIEDEGPGFPKDEIPFVFDKFYRLKHAAGNGTGLGLSIVKGFAAALGGTVQLQNRAAGGAAFTIEIPAESSYFKV